MRAELLRDKARLTRLLILEEVRDRRPSKLKTVADALDVTVQAVSNYMRALQADGLVTQEGGEYAVTREGLQLLHDGFNELKHAVDETVARLNVIETTAAVAAAPVTPGEAVGLVLREGVLHADPASEAGSRGVALHAAAQGEDVAVRDLRGVVDLRPGTLWVLPVPTVDDGGSRALHAPRLLASLEARGVSPDRVAAVGVEAWVLARKAGLGPHIEFAPVDAAHHAASLGVSVLLLASRDRLKDALAELDALAEGELERVPVEILEPPAPEAAQ